MTNSNRPGISALKSEIKVITSRSGGPGGQHVNKVETKVTLKLNIDQSEVLSSFEKEIIKAKHAQKMTKEGELMVSSDSKRSQIKNKEMAFKKLDRLIAQAFTKKKPRKATQPSQAAKQKRLKDKKIQSEKKKWRQPPG